MKKILLLFLFICILTPRGRSQEKAYTESGGEIIFSFAEVVYNQTDLPVNMRFTLFFHLNQRIHYNFTKNLGMYSGFGIRNVGFITDYQDIKVKRRTYSFGIPLALKLGSFDDHFYVYGGGSYELFFHYKQKRFIDDNKSKFTEWFSPRTERFVPSVFGGVQFPGGVNLQFRYYLKDFLNKDFRGYDFGEAVDYSNYSQSKMFYISVSFYLKNDLFDEKMDTQRTRLAFYD